MAWIDSVAESRPVARYLMDDTTTVMRDSGPNALHGAWDTTPVAAAAIAPGSSAAMSGGWGSSPTTGVPDGATSWGKSGYWSVEGWFSPATWRQYNRLLSRRKANEYGPAWMIQEGASTGSLMLYTSSSYYTLAPAGSLPLDTPTHVAVVADGSTVRAYVNGSLSRTVTIPAPLTGSSNFKIGGSADGNNYPFSGTIDDVAVFDRALPGEEVEAHYLGTPFTPPVTPLSGWGLIPI